MTRNYAGTKMALSIWLVLVGLMGMISLVDRTAQPLAAALIGGAVMTVVVYALERTIEED